MQTIQLVIGPTASGKTAYSISLADQLGDAEIINADSRQLYRFLDIGTAKITKEEMQGIPHHLLDVLDPNEDATVGWYVKQTTKVINDIHSRGKTPILVGGSMLYISAIIDGLTLAPASDPAIREKLTKEYDSDAGESLYKRLQELDPVAAKSIHKNNMPHLVRAVEICEMTNEPKSSAVSTSIPEYNFAIQGMQWEREELQSRITARTKQMFAAGWIHEVQELVDRGYTKNDPAMKSHGYKEIMDYLDTGKPSLEVLQEQIAAKSRQYAKRQMTWWRNDPRIVWVKH